MEKLINLTQKQYEQQFKPDGWSILHLGITQSWRTEWGEWESIRDLVQNALDETESFAVETSGINLLIKDTGTGLAVKDLFLGAQKTKEKHLRGKFGEGLKVAALALLRLNYGVTIQTVGKDIVFVMYEQEIDNDIISTLSALWKNNTIEQGTVVTIQDYDFTKQDYSEKFTQTASLDVLHKTKSSITTPIQRYNYIYKATKGKATIFCRNIYMRDIDGDFSYDLWDFELSPDRHAPRYEFEMWRNIAQLWQTVESEKLMVSFFKHIRDKKAKYLLNNVTLDNYEWDKTPDGIPFCKLMEANSEKWNRAFLKVNGEVAVLRTTSLETQVEAVGKKSIELPSGLTEVLKQCIDTDEALIKSHNDKQTEIEIIEDRHLDPRQVLVLNAARELSHGLPEAPAGLFAANLPLLGRFIVTAEYLKKTKQIFFAPATLTSWETMLKSLIHEAAHMIGGSMDCTKEHTESIEYAGVAIATYIATNPEFCKRYECIIN